MNTHMQLVGLCFSQIPLNLTSALTFSDLEEDQNLVQHNLQNFKYMNVASLMVSITSIVAPIYIQSRQ